MNILPRVCAEFHDKSGAILYTIRSNQLLGVVYDVPEAIRQDPLFDMLVYDNSLEVIETKKDQKRVENDPDLKPVNAEKRGRPAKSGKSGSAAESVPATESPASADAAPAAESPDAPAPGKPAKA